MSEYAVMPLEDYKNTCDKVREKTGSEETIKSGELAGEVEKVYEAGKSAEYNKMWDTIQTGGKRANYVGAFRYWKGNDVFYPKYDMKPTDCNNMFAFYEGDSKGFNLKKRLEECGVTLDTSKATTMHYMFDWSYITHAPIIDISSNTLMNGVFQSTYLQYIEKVILSPEGTNVGTAFSSSSKLKDVVFEGKFINNVNFKVSPLTADSAKSIISCLTNYAGTDEELSYSLSFARSVWTRLNESGAPPSENTWEEYVNTLGYNVVSV